MIRPLTGDDMGVYRDENHTVFEWVGRSRIVFSATRMGDALSCHMAFGKEAMREVRQSIEEAFDFMMKACPWCTMVFVNIFKDRHGLRRILERCGFCVFGDLGDTVLYVRLR